MKVNIKDPDLQELILTGKNRKYEKYSRDRKFMEGLARAYKVMLNVANNASLSSVRVLNGRVERLLFRETEDGIEITLIELNTDHYGNKN